MAVSDQVFAAINEQGLVCEIGSVRSKTYNSTTDQFTEGITWKTVTMVVEDNAERKVDGIVVKGHIFIIAYKALDFVLKPGDRIKYNQETFELLQVELVQHNEPVYYEAWA
jgi:hypothetical protein